MTTVELLSAILATSAFTAIINHFVNIRTEKTNNRLTTAKAKEAEADADMAEMERDEKLSEYYRKELAKVLAELKLVRKELDEVRKMLEMRDKEDCIKTDCPNRKTKNGKN